MTRKSYGQYCGLAKALDHIGDRWTLLIVRELLIGPRRYSQIRSSLPGVATNLLADRLRGLEADSIIRRDGGTGSYELTDLGRGLEGAVHELVRWGGRWMRQRDPADRFEPEWLAVALSALIPSRRSGRVEVRADDLVLTIDRGGVAIGGVQQPDAVVEGPPEALLGVAAGEVPFSALKVHGDVAAARRAMGAKID